MIYTDYTDVMYTDYTDTHMSTQQCALMEPCDSTTAYLLGALLNTVQRKHRHLNLKIDFYEH